MKRKPPDLLGPFRKAIANSKRALVPGPAKWRTSKHDIEVKILEYLGEKDGVRYYLVESNGGRTGIPETELVQDIKV